MKLVESTHPLLYEPTKEFVFDGSTDPKELSETMFELMEKHQGVGLSANQIGLNYKVFVLGHEGYKLTVFNPRIMEESKEQVIMEEGCLSFPLVIVKVKRPKSIVAEYQDETGEKLRINLSGLTARIFLHEYDHMLGITMRQRVSAIKWNVANGKKRKIEMKIRRSKNGNSA